MRNNWRGKNLLKAEPTAWKVSQLDIVWQDKREDVKKMIYILHNQDKSEPSEPNDKVVFGLRTAAAKEVYMALTIDEQLALDRQAELAAKEPIAPEVQER